MNWRSKSGAYLLFLRLDSQTELKVGRLGEFHLQPGIYIYVGSAMGGFGRRLPRYFSSRRKVKWHIDYLLEKAELEAILLLPSSTKIEQEIAARLAKMEGISEVVPGFDASDSTEKTHLFMVDEEHSPFKSKASHDSGRIK